MGESLHETDNANAEGQQAEALSPSKKHPIRKDWIQN
jgi:hypothetical protein